MICPTRARDPLRASMPNFACTCGGRWTRAGDAGRRVVARRQSDGCAVQGSPNSSCVFQLSTSATTMPERSARSDTMSWANHCPDVSLHESAAFEGIEHARTERRLHSHVRGSERQRDEPSELLASHRVGNRTIAAATTASPGTGGHRRPMHVAWVPLGSRPPAGDRLASACCHDIRVRSSRRRRAVRDPRSGGGPPTQGRLGISWLAWLGRVAGPSWRDHRLRRANPLET